MWADDFFSSSDLQTDQDLNDEAKHQANITEDRLFTLEDFTYNNSGVANRIFHHLSQIEFTGITVITFFCNHTLINYWSSTNIYSILNG